MAYNKKFHINYYKAEVVQLGLMSQGIEKKKTWNREMVQFYRKKRNRTLEVAQFKKDIVALDWLKYCNELLKEKLEKELKKFPKSLRFPKIVKDGDKKDSKKGINK